MNDPALDAVAQRLLHIETAVQRPRSDVAATDAKRAAAASPEPKPLPVAPSSAWYTRASRAQCPAGE